MYERENLFRISYAIQDILRRTSNQRYFTKFLPLENATFSGLLLSFCSAVSIARSKIYFTPEACAELSKIPACRLARASTLQKVGMQNLSLGHHLSSRASSLREHSLQIYNTESGETGDIIKKDIHGINSQINRFGSRRKDR